MTLVLKDIPEPANRTWPAHVPKGWGGDGRGSKTPRGWGDLETDVHDSVLGALMCYPGGWCSRPAALFVGVIEFLFYQIPTQTIRVERLQRVPGIRMGWVASGVGICQT